MNLGKGEQHKSLLNILVKAVLSVHQKKMINKKVIKDYVASDLKGIKFL